MNKKYFLAFFTSLALFCGCKARNADAKMKEISDKEEKDFAYRTFFLPRASRTKSAYAGDCMPFYENGVFYVYYLKDGGNSFNHSIFLATTSDFVNWQEIENPVLEASRTGGQDSWIGTGSVVKVDSTYYFFYTGHADGFSEYGEKIMLAKSDNLFAFQKVADWSICPDDSLGQKRDFRDPQAYYSAETGKITLTVTASQDGKARILKYSMDAGETGLENISYDGIIFTDESASYFNLECSDTFSINGFHYLTYSAQDDTHFYAIASSPYGEYSRPRRLDGKLFYAAKHVEKDGKHYLVGWGRRSEEPLFTSDVNGWAGNIVALQIFQNTDGSLYLSLPDTVISSYKNGDIMARSMPFTVLEQFLITGDFTFAKNGTFSLIFDCDSEENSKAIYVDSEKQMISLLVDGGEKLISYADTALETKKSYHFKYLQEGSLGVFCIEGEAVLTVRVYGSYGHLLRFFTPKGSRVKFSNIAVFTP